MGLDLLGLRRGRMLLLLLLLIKLVKVMSLLFSYSLLVYCVFKSLLLCCVCCVNI